MKYFVNIIWAFLISWISRSVINQHVSSPEIMRLTYWIFSVPLGMQIAVLWALFSFPSSTGRLFILIGNGIMQLLTFVAQNTGQLVEHVWKYRAGKIVIGIGIIYLLYTFIF